MIIAFAAAALSCTVEHARYSMRRAPEITATFQDVSASRAANGSDNWWSDVAFRIHMGKTNRTYWFLPWAGGTDAQQHLASTTAVDAPGWKPPNPDGGPRPLGDFDYIATDAQYNVIDHIPRRGGTAPAHILVPRLGDAGGRFALSRLLRGRGGTEAARFGHTVGETFCLLRPGTLQSIALPAWAIGADVDAKMAASNTTRAFEAQSLRPLSAVNLRAERGGDGTLRLSWTRRSRLGFAWIDGIDVSLGEESERYRIAIAGTTGSIELWAETTVLVVDAPALASIGTGPATIEVVQVGDFLPSAAEQLDIIIA